MYLGMKVKEGIIEPNIRHLVDFEIKKQLQHI